MWERTLSDNVLRTPAKRRDDSSIRSNAPKEQIRNQGPKSHFQQRELRASPHRKLIVCHLTNAIRPFSSVPKVNLEYGPDSRLMPWVREDPGTAAQPIATEDMVSKQTGNPRLFCGSRYAARHLRLFLGESRDFRGTGMDLIP